ncbi:SufE family protein [Shewanella sp. NIFS-20-20]|uniref:SufE family protein n=1 Tax=Shewanella sp. NIFS-20-20 TaxID=2853806 RepID=UPI001C47FFBA|nr:SufE family protein [Shewanella sp. NIFS-20-20]MBV7316991.1 SufE family protein [Shewanella sp. NIFS-20-20]
MPAVDQFEWDQTPLQQAVAQLAQQHQWQDKYRLLMQLGKQLPALASQWQIEAAQVKGCESQVWLYHYETQGNNYFLVDSNARIIKGLIAIVLNEVQGKTHAQIQSFDVKECFDSLGLSQQLSPSRTNGLVAVVDKIQQASHGLA